MTTDKRGFAYRLARNVCLAVLSMCAIFVVAHGLAAFILWDLGPPRVDAVFLRLWTAMLTLWVSGAVAVTILTKKQ